MSSLLKFKKLHFYTNLYNIFGVGDTTIKNCYLKWGVNTHQRPKNIKRQQKIKVFKLLKKKIIGKQLKKLLRLNINRHWFMRSCRGIRHKWKYPVRGQRTHTNARTKRKLPRFI